MKNINKITWRDIKVAFGNIYDDKECKVLFNQNKKWLKNFAQKEEGQNVLQAFINHIGDQNFPPIWR